MTPARMTDQQLHDETLRVLSKPVNTASFEYLRDLRAESDDRWQAAGHTRDCTGGIRWRAYAQATEINPALPRITVGCSCKEDQP